MWFDVSGVVGIVRSIGRHESDVKAVVKGDICHVLEDAGNVANVKNVLRDVVRTVVRDVVRSVVRDVKAVLKGDMCHVLGSVANVKSVARDVVRSVARDVKGAVRPGVRSCERDGLLTDAVRRGVVKHAVKSVGVLSREQFLFHIPLFQQPSPSVLALAFSLC